MWAEHYDGVVAGVAEPAGSDNGQRGGIDRAVDPRRRDRAEQDASVPQPRCLRPRYACAHVWSLEYGDNCEATKLLEEALRLDPDYPSALSLAAWCRGQRVVYNWSTNIQEDKRETLRLAQAAAALARDDPFILTVLGAALTITREFAACGVDARSRALSLDPNSAWAWNRSGWLHAYLDDPETAIDQFERSLRLSPFDPMAFNCEVGIGGAHFIARRYEAAAQWMERP